jgi:hypothetical protein
VTRKAPPFFATNYLEKRFEQAWGFSLGLFVRLFVCCFVCAFVRLVVCLFVCWFVGSCVCLFVCSFVCLFVRVCVCVFVSLVGWLYAKRLPKTHIVGKTSRDFNVAKGAGKEEKSHSPTGI